MKYFTINELIRSTTAVAKGINNLPNSVQTNNLYYLVDNVLDPIRELWGGPIRVNSGFRSYQLNEAVGGSKTSLHKEGLAADITVGSPIENKRLFDVVISGNIPYHQLIEYEGYKWLHISIKREGNKRQVLHF